MWGNRDCPPGPTVMPPPPLAGPPPAHTPRQALPSLWPASQPCLGPPLLDRVRGSGRGTARGPGWDARGNTDLDFVGAPSHVLPCTADPRAHRREARPRGRTCGSAFLLQNSAQRTHLLTGGKRGPGEGRGEVPSYSRTRLPPGVCPPGANPPGVIPLGDTPALRRTGSWPPGALSLVEMGHHRGPACPACPP